MSSPVNRDHQVKNKLVRNIYEYSKENISHDAKII